jgi:hypothetical protein
VSERAPGPSPHGGPVLPLVVAFAALLAAQLVRLAWLPSVRDIPARVHGEMLGGALAIAFAVLAIAGGLELRRRARGGARLAAGAAAIAATGVLVAEMTGLFAYARGLGLDAGPDQERWRAVAVFAADARAIAMMTLACALAAAAWPARATRWLAAAFVVAVGVGMPLRWYASALGSSTAARAVLAALPAVIGLVLAAWHRPAAPDGVEPARVRAALERAAGAMAVLVVVAAAGVLVAVAVFVKKTTDPTGLAVVVALATLGAQAVLARALLAIPAHGAARAALALAAGALAAYLAFNLVHMVEVLRIFLASETVGTLSTDGRAALPSSLPLAVPAILALAWVLVAFGFRALAATLDRPGDRTERRAVVARVGRGAVNVLGCQAAILGVLGYLDHLSYHVTRNGALTGATVLAIIAIASLLQLGQMARALATAHA